MLPRGSGTKCLCPGGVLPKFFIVRCEVLGVRRGGHHLLLPVTRRDALVIAKMLPLSGGEIND